jgi:hypothetical protein
MIKYAAQLRMAVKCDDFRVWNCLCVTSYYKSVYNRSNSFKNVNICSVLSYVITTDLQKHPHWFTLNTILNMPGRQ